MKVLKKDSYTLITIEKIGLENININDFISDHVILEFSDNVNIQKSEISLFLKTATDFKTNGMSFVLVKSGIDIDDFPESLNISPTIQEAEDILEMEAIERDLGF